MGKVSKVVRERYNAKVYDRVELRLRKESNPSKDRVQADADAAGESLNSYITKAVKSRMETGK